MPVFFSLFYMLRKDLRHDICPALNPPQVSNPKPCGSTDTSQFFFIPDITNSAHGAVLITLLVLYVGSQLVSSLFMSTTADRNQRLLMMGLPFFFVPFVIGFPAGLLVYWITTNLWTVGQGYILRKKLGPIMPPQPQPAAAGGGGGGADGGGAGGAGGFFARLTGAATAPRPAPSPSADADGSGSKSRPRPAPSGGPPPRPPRKKKKRSGRRR
jgi:YidC/Oxa1 family membrane protein insertase